jgi:methyl-accepting chemotaxis protein
MHILRVTSASGETGALVVVTSLDVGEEAMADRYPVRRTQDARLLRESLDLVAPVAPEMIAAFYDQLFLDHPALRPMFPTAMDLQRERLLKAITALVTRYDRPAALVPALNSMGRSHVRYGVQLDHYAAFGSALLATLRRFAGDAWSPDYEGAWQRAYSFAAGTMMAAAALAPGVPGTQPDQPAPISAAPIRTAPISAATINTATINTATVSAAA